MNRLLTSLLPLLSSIAANAQDQATTLLACARQATVVVRATVLGATDPSPEWHRLHFRADEVLKGNVGGEFVLLEPAGACCGRSLFAMTNGDRCLLFLRATGPSLHPVGGSRGVLADEPALANHVRQLLAAMATGDVAVGALLAANLEHAEPRVANDAAQALAALPTLQLGALQRDAVAVALGAAIEQRATTAAPLVDVLVRLGDDGAVATLTATYMATPLADQGTLLRRGLVRCTSESTTTIVTAAAGGDTTRQLRAAEVLAAMPVERSAGALRRLITTTSCPRVKLCATQALLEAGAPASDFARDVPASVLDLAEKRRDEARKFRSIRPVKS